MLPCASKSCCTRSGRSTTCERYPGLASAKKQQSGLFYRACTQRSQKCVVSATNLTAEEEQFYQSALSQRKRRRTLRTEETKRRRNFDPAERTSDSLSQSENRSPEQKVQGRLVELRRKQLQAEQEEGQSEDNDNIDYEAIGHFEAWMQSDEPQRSRQNSGAGPKQKSAPRSNLGDGEQVYQFEELLKVLELVEEKQNAKDVKSRDRVQALEENINWESIGKALLGDSWAKEFEDVWTHDKNASDSTDDSADNSDETAAAGTQEPWLDEVTTLLLGLMDTSHHRYLGTPLLPSSSTEDDRASLVWNAPYALFIHDDTSKAGLEYMNKKALDLLGYNYYDIFELTSFDLIADEDNAQQEWLWSLNDAEESFEKYTVVPQLELRTKTGEKVVAKDVTIFRLENLEDEYIGQVVLVKQLQSAGLNAAQ